MGAKEEAQEWAETVARYGERHELNTSRLAGSIP